VFEVFTYDDGRFKAFSYPPNQQKKVKLTGKEKQIHDFKEVSKFIRPEEGVYKSYGLATIDIANQTINFLPCNPTPILTKGTQSFPNSTDFELYEHTGENKIWAIANNGSGDVIYCNERSGNTMVFQNVDLDAIDQDFRIEDKLNNGYKKKFSRVYFCLDTFNFLTK